jgi:DNA-binding SARP family transcriptional activator
MEIRLLGPLEVLDSGLKLEFGGVTQRSLPAVLLLHANEVVSVGRLIDELWGRLPAADRRQEHPGLRLSVAQAVRQRPHPLTASPA